jgi:hypothetical protein
MKKEEIDSVSGKKELVWGSALGKRTKISELDHQYLSNILWFNEVFNDRTRYNCSVQLELEEELIKRFPTLLNVKEGIRLPWKPLPIPEEIEWIKKKLYVDELGKIWRTGVCIGSLSHIKDWDGPKQTPKKPITFKETVLQFVESKGTARFSEIQEFAVDFRLGKGAYKKGYMEVETPGYNYMDERTSKLVKTNIHRGMYCGNLYRDDGYWKTDTSRLCRISRGVYKVVRDKK